MEETEELKIETAAIGTVEYEVMYLIWLGRDILGYTELNVLHCTWFSDLLIYSRILLLAPREHFKTTVCTLVWTIYRVVCNINIRILLLHEILKKSKAYLRAIKGHFQRNDKFRKKFGYYDEFTDKWSEVEISVVVGQIDPTIEVASALGSIQGGHHDLILPDDVIGLKNARSATQRNKLSEWIREEIFPTIDRGGQIIFTGTRKNPGDFYGDILKKGEFPGWKKIVLKAEYPDGRILFPERWSRKRLDQKRKEMGEEVYRREYLNEPVSPGSHRPKYDWFEFYVTPPEQMSKFQGIDLAISITDRAAYFALMTIGIPVEGDVYVLDYRREKIDFPTQCQLVKDEYRKHRPIVTGIEAVAYQEALPQWLRHDKEARRMSILPITGYSDKTRRINSLMPLFKDKVIKIKKEHHEFIDEYLDFPDVGTFDLLDSLVFAIEASNDRVTEPTIWETSI